MVKYPINPAVKPDKVYIIAHGGTNNAGYEARYPRSPPKPPKSSHDNLFSRRARKNAGAPMVMKVMNAYSQSSGISDDSNKKW